MTTRSLIRHLEILAVLSLFSAVGVAQVQLGRRGPKPKPVDDSVPAQFFGLITSSLDLSTYLTYPGQPLPLGQVTDTLFGKTLTRTGNSAEDMVELVPVYSKRQPWNVDGTRFFLYGVTGGRFHLMNGTTFSYIEQMDSLEYDGLDVELQWANLYTAPGCVNPSDTMFYRFQKSLKTYCVSNEVKAVVHTFATHASATAIGNKDEGNQSDDDNRWAFVSFNGATGAQYDVYSYSRVTDTVTANKDILTMSNGTRQNGAVNAINWIGSSPSGNYVIVNWATNGSTRGFGVDVFSSALVFQRHICNTNNHGDVGFNAAGEEVYVAMCDSNFADRTFNIVRLSDGSTTNLVVPSPYNLTFTCCHHVSLQGTRGPTGLKGYALLSHYTNNGTRYGSIYSETSWGADELIAVKLDDTQRWYRIGQQFNIKATTDLSCGSPGCNYFQEPHAVPNRNFTKVVFGSSWLNNMNPPRSYVYTLP
jgi:hypothetical protein